MASSVLLSNPFLTSPHNPNNLTRRQQPLTLRPSSAFTLLSLTKPSNNNNNPKFLKPTVPFLGFKKFATRISTKDADTDTSVPPPLAGEDSAAFELGKQKVSSWIYFSLILGVVLFVLDVAWIDNSTGFGKDFISAVSSLSESPEVGFIYLFFVLLLNRAYGILTHRNLSLKWFEQAYLMNYTLHPSRLSCLCITSFIYVYLFH
jgi:zeta-carotene isomerase